MPRISKTTIVLLFLICSQTLISCSSSLIPVSEDAIPTVQKQFSSNKDVYDLAVRYRNLVEGNDYTKAINQAIKDAHQAGGGIILFPGNKTVEISSAILIEDKISFESSVGIATIKCAKDFTDNQMVVITSKKQLLFSNIRFDGNQQANGIASYGKDNTDINIHYCEFINFKAAFRRGTGIALQNTASVHIDHCLFKDSDFGIRFDKRNTDLYIENNTFEGSLTKNPLRIQGNAITIPEDQRFFSENIWIRNNTITIGRADSIIEELNILTRDPQTGAVDISLVNGKTDSDYKQYADWRKGRFGPSAIYLTCGNEEQEDNDESINYHRNVVIEGNVVEGPDYGFFDGGSADLYSLKDIHTLNCSNNIARNSGDLGFSIERSRDVIVSHNTATRNNSFGIAFSYVNNGLISNNLCKNNALRRNLIYNNIPYGSILITGFSKNTVVRDNYLTSDPITKVSLNKDVAKLSYSSRNSPSDFYGVILKADKVRKGIKIVENIPSFNTVEANQFEGFNLGPIYNQSTSLQLKDCFSSSDKPKNLDYPLHTFVLNSNTNYPVAGWRVVYREETTLASQWNGTDTKVALALSNRNIQNNDVIGITLNNGVMYWTLVDDTSIFTNTVALKTHTATHEARMGSKVIILRWQDQVK